jgi:hypothetical protein
VVYFSHWQKQLSHTFSDRDVAYLLRGVKTLTLVENVSRDTLIETGCVAVLCCIVMMSYFLGNDGTSVNAFYFVDFSQPLSWCFLS